MGLPWVRLDVQFPSNPKVLDLVAAKQYRAAFAYLCSLAYAGQHGTDGYLPENCLMFLHASKAEANQLVAVGLWRADSGGWLINGWDEFQVSDDAAKKRRERAQKGGLAKAAKSQQGGLHSV